MIRGAVLSPCRIVCEMGEAKPSQHAGFVEICVAVCRPEFMARSSQLYYFMVSPDHQQPSWASASPFTMIVGPLWANPGQGLGSPVLQRLRVGETWVHNLTLRGWAPGKWLWLLGPTVPFWLKVSLTWWVRVWAMHENS